MLRNVRKIGTKLAIFSNLNGYACWRTQIGDRVTDDLVVKNGKTRTCYDHQVFCRCRYFVLWEGWTSSECCMLAAGQSWAGFFGCPLAFIHGHGHEHPVTQGRSPDIIYIYHSPISISTVVISCFIQFRTGSCTSPVITRSPQHWPMRWHKDVSLQALRDWADWSISEATDELQLLLRFAMNGWI